MKDILLLFVLTVVAAASGEKQSCNTNEQLCQRCSYNSDGTPSPEYYCTSNSTPCPPLVCCDIATEDTCYDSTTDDPISCARRIDGGCDCPDLEVKCHGGNHTSAVCTTLCCDWRIEQTCMNSNNEPIMCKKYDEGPCPIPKDDDSERKHSTDEESSSTSSSDDNKSSDKDFKVNARLGGTTKVQELFKYKANKCIQDENTTLLTSITLQRCAKKCVNVGLGCKGIEFFVDHVSTRHLLPPKKIMASSCLLVRSIDDEVIVDCEDEYVGKVELYSREAELEDVAMIA